MKIVIIVIKELKSIIATSSCYQPYKIKMAEAPKTGLGGGAECISFHMENG